MLCAKEFRREKNEEAGVEDGEAQKLKGVSFCDDLTYYDKLPMSPFENKTTSLTRNTTHRNSTYTTLSKTTKRPKRRQVLQKKMSYR